MNLSWWISYAWVQFLVLRLCTSQDTISINQLFRDGDVLISNGGNFALGFFSPGKSNYRYVGIWCHKVPERSIVWVANRDNPINDTSGFLAIDTHGNLVIFYENNDQKVQLWSTNASVSPTNNSVARLLDSGNLVLFPKQSNKLLWQSFDDPTNTMISYMKLGIDRRTGLKRFLTSWKSEDDPGTGNYTYKIDPNGSPQIFLYKGQVPWWRSGHWNGIRWSGVPIMQGNSLINASFVNNNNEMSYMWSVYNTSILSRIVVDESGSVKRFMWFEQERGWNEIWSAPADQCDKYGHCSTFGLCDPYNATEFECTCLPGFEPKSPSEWYFGDARHGCVRKPGSLICRKGDGFVRIANVKVPDTSKVQLISSLSLKACEQDCLRNCNCIAYASADIREGGSGCITWHENLIDTRKLTVGGQDFYIRVDEQELAQYAKKSKGVATKGIRAIMAVFGILILFGISFFAYWFVKRKRKGTGETLPDVNISEESLKEKKLGESRRQTDLQLFDIRTLITATDNFSATNKLGEGGFGSVFKGHLVDGQEMAVKRLSKHSGQGLEEFKNEVMVIAKLQHRNLVRLLGCCIHKEEKMLIYEYLPNKSLDYFIYDVTRRSCLDWNKRFEIVKGIARGILYLHHDSRLKVIHRDLKASNILLDAAMNPKISDFGMAKMFGEDQIKANTKRVVGTYGYMSPEYAMHGVYSTKSDVYSFGVLLLEIISGRKNTDFIDGSHLIGHVWELWKEERILDTVDPTIVIRPLLEEEVSRCIHVGLLCVQEGAIERPSMSSVVFMLANETTLPPPNTPAFILQQKCFDAELSTSRSGGGVSLNSITITTLEAR